ncbi:hypothetical protein [Maridesulfovibrio ferrireducens]|uniref:hypothetical protein n=1 Tax=Maridesulfovibrio ferrireducens TaxID=246191 RepID=UPI001A1C0992|nr:hypothetical protein [Maridesulfovibrio ferrireducens]MBI9109775.1 hypothetical protein [Maridesulfovibrio ferrireducens]
MPRKHFPGSDAIVCLLIATSSCSAYDLAVRRTSSAPPASAAGMSPTNRNRRVK